MNHLPIDPAALVRTGASRPIEPISRAHAARCRQSGIGVERGTRGVGAGVEVVDIVRSSDPAATRAPRVTAYYKTPIGTGHLLIEPPLLPVVGAATSGSLDRGHIIGGAFAFYDSLPTQSWDATSVEGGTVITREVRLTSVEGVSTATDLLAGRCAPRVSVIHVLSLHFDHAAAGGAGGAGGGVETMVYHGIPSDSAIAPLLAAGWKRCEAGRTSTYSQVGATIGPRLGVSVPSSYLTLRRSIPRTELRDHLDVMEHWANFRPYIVDATNRAVRIQPHAVGGGVAYSM